MGAVAIGALVLSPLNTDASSTVENAVVSFSITTATKYSATDSYLIAKLEDGKTIQLYLPAGWIPLTTGKQIRVKRITRLFFGERFVLLKQP